MSTISVLVSRSRYGAARPQVSWPTRGKQRGALATDLEQQIDEDISEENLQ